MAPDKRPFFRQVIIPWYDTDAACIAAVVVLALIAIFATIGVSAALETPGFHAHIWVPLVLMVLSLGVIASILARLIKRTADRFFK